MTKPLDPNQTLNYLADLHSLLEQARFFLDLKNRQEKETDFQDFDKLLRIYALNLTLISLEEFESLPFEKVFERLQWLLEEEKSTTSGTIPVNLDELTEKLSQEKSRIKNRKIADEITKLTKDLANRNKLLKALKETRIEPEISSQPQTDWEKIISSLEKTEEFTVFIQKTIDNPKISIPEKEAACQKIWESFLNQRIPAEISKDAKQQPLSLESFKLLANQLRQPINQRKSLIEYLENVSKPLTQSQTKKIQENLLAKFTAYVPLAKDFGWEKVAKIISRETQKEFPNTSLEQIYRISKPLSETAEKTLPSQTIVFENSILAPPIIIIDQKIVPLVHFVEIKGNPKGNHWQIIDPDNQPLLYYWTTTGISPAELEKLEKIQRVITNNPHSSSCKLLSQYTNKLKEFQNKYFSQEAVIWQSNRIRAIFNTSQVITPFVKFGQQIKKWFFQTRIGHSLKLWLAKISQKTLESLWNTAKAGIKKGLTKLVTGILVKIGLHAVANTLAPVIGTAIVFLGEKIIKGGFSLAKKFGNLIISGFGLTNVILEGITGQREIKEDRSIGKLALIGIMTIILITGLSFFTITNKQGGLIGRGSSASPSSPRETVPKPPECQQPRHLAEEVICLLTHSPCNLKQINKENRELIRNCLSNISMISSEAALNLINILQNYYCYYEPECPLQCLQFVIAITDALGQNMNLGFDYAGLYADNFPPTYKKIDSPQTGDIAVWRGDPGHIGIVIDVIIGPEETAATAKKILVAEANFDRHGGIGLIERAGAGMPGSPSVYLRFVR